MEIEPSVGGGDIEQNLRKYIDKCSGHSIHMKENREQIGEQGVTGENLSLARTPRRVSGNDNNDDVPESPSGHAAPADIFFDLSAH